MSMSKPLKDSSAAANVVAESQGRGRRDDKSSMTATAGTGAGAASTNRNNADREGGPNEKIRSSDSTKETTAAAATDASLRVEREKGEANRPSVADSALTAAKAKKTKEPTGVAAAAVEVATAIKGQEHTASLVKQTKKLKMDKDQAEKEAEQYVVYLQKANKDLRGCLFMEKQAMEKTIVSAFSTSDEKAAMEKMDIATLPRLNLPVRVEYLPASDKLNMSFHVCGCEGCRARSEYPNSAFVAFFPPGNGHAKGFASPDIPLPDKARHAVIRHLREKGADMSNLPPAIPLLEPWVVSKELKSYKDRGQEGFDECILLACASRGCLPCLPGYQCRRTVFFCQCEVCNNDDLENAYAVGWCSCESTCGSGGGGGGGGDFAPYDVPLPHATIAPVVIVGRVSAAPSDDDAGLADAIVDDEVVLSRLWERARRNGTNVHRS